MRVETTEFQVILVPETPFEQAALKQVLRRGAKIISKALDSNWPPEREALVLQLPDPNDWGT